MVTLAGSTGLRRSEMFALRWVGMSVPGRCRCTSPKGLSGTTLATPRLRQAARPVPLHGTVLAVLNQWRSMSIYQDDTGFLFPSVRKNGTQAPVPGHGDEQVRPAGSEEGWNRRQDDRLAQLPSFAGDEPAFNGGGL